MRRSISRWIVVSTAVTVAALTLVLSALADKEQVKLTAADQAFARAAVLTRADLGTASGWTGGAVKPDLSSAPPCGSFKPKQSDLVLTGAAETNYKQTGLSFDSEAQVLRTAQMVKLDWQRTVVAPQLLPCLRTILAKKVGASTRVISVRRFAFPHVAEYAAGIRVLVEVQTPTAPVSVFVDVVFIGRGRTEITLTTTAPLIADTVVRAAEVRLARLLAARARA